MELKTMRFGGKEFNVGTSVTGSGSISCQDCGIPRGLKIIPLLVVCQRSKREGKNVAKSGYPRGDITRYLAAGVCHNCAFVGYDEAIAESR